MSEFNSQEWALGHLRKLEDKGFNVDQLSTIAKGLADAALGNYRTRWSVRSCSFCEKFQGCSVKALGYGSFNSPVMIVSERAGEDDIKWGQAMVGTDGFLLTYLLDLFGVDRQSVYVTSLIKCYKDGVKPGQDEADNCFVHLANEIDVIKPAVIITLGQIVTKTLLGDDQFRLHTQEDGGSFRQYAGYQVRPTYSLDYVLEVEGDRHTAAKRTVYKDFKAAFNLADEIRPGYVYRSSPQPVTA